MNKDQAAEIAERLRALRDSSRESNRSISVYCDVAERTVAGWASPKNPMGMTFDHAEKVAELFEVDLDWFWRGRERGPSAETQLDQIENKVDEALEHLEALVGVQGVADAAQESGQSGERTVPGQASKAK